MSTREEYELIYNGSVVGPESIENSYIAAMRAADGDSNDEEIQLLKELVDELLRFAQIRVEAFEVQKCDECEEGATNFWPYLRKPVHLCDSCEHNARRSGWEPGQ